MTRTRYTPEELAKAWEMDLISDAICAEKQAMEGPFYPELDITRESLLKYAVKCREQAGESIPKEFARQLF